MLLVATYVLRTSITLPVLVHVEPKYVLRHSLPLNLVRSVKSTSHKAHGTMVLRQAILALSMPSLGINRAAALIVLRPIGAADLSATRMFSAPTSVTTSADVTETIRRQSHDQMSNLISASTSTSDPDEDSCCPIASQLLTSSGDVASYLKTNVDSVLFDCDGVIVLTEEVLLCPELCRAAHPRCSFARTHGCCV